tara:strand:- start:113 stop:2953 length:2841 start_codon:yes stop_codon:yes gene_type:complete
MPPAVVAREAAPREPEHAAGSAAGTSSTVLGRCFAPETIPALAQAEMDERKLLRRKKASSRAKKIQKRHNKPHVAYLRRRLMQMLPEVQRREQADNEAFERGEVPTVPFDGEGQPIDVGFAQLMRSSTVDNGTKRISHTQICNALAVDGRGALLGYPLRGDARVSALTASSNLETATLKSTIDNLEEILDDVPFDGGGFHLLPEQRLAIGMYDQPTNRDVACRFKRVGVVEEEAVEITRPAQQTSDIWFNTATPGSGKTAKVLISLLKTIVSDEAWAKTQAKWRKKNGIGRDVNNLGLVRKRQCAGRELARVIVCLVPDSLVHQWAAHAQKLVPVFRQSCGKGFRVWVGSNAEVRQTTTQVGMPKTMEEAHKLTASTKRAMLWILTADTKATNITTRQAPHIAFVAKLFDEVAGTRNTEPREHKPESEVMKIVVINATVKQLKDATENQSTHPIRRAFNRERLDFQSPEQMAILYHCTVPHWARHLLALGMRPVMPAGVELMNFGVRQASLAAAINGTSDMVITTIDDLLDHILTGLGIPKSDEGERVLKSMKKTAKDILTGQAVHAGGSIAAMLKKSEEDATNRLSSFAKALSSEQYGKLTLEQKRSEDVRAQKRKCFLGMERLFKTLYDAIDPNPGEPRCCPITFEDTEPEDVVVMACCGNWLKRRAFNRMASNPDARQRKCAFCCGPMGNHGVDDQRLQGVLAPLLQGPEEGGAPEEEGEEEEAAAAAIAPGDGVAFCARLSKLRETPFTAGPQAAIEVLKHAMAFKGGKGLRVMLTFHYELAGVYGGDSLTNKVRELIMKEVSGLTTVEPVAQTREDEQCFAVKDYQKNDETNRVLIVNTTRGSNSLGGLNLGNTDLVIFDRTKSERGRFDRLSSSQIVQAIGRALRPQPQPPLAEASVPFNPYLTPDPQRPDKPPLENDAGFVEPPESPFPAKLILFLDSV